MNGAFEEVEERKLPDDVNVVGLLLVFKVKTDKKGTRKLKARFCPLGNENKDKDDIRSDSSDTQFAITRL